MFFTHTVGLCQCGFRIFHVSFESRWHVMSEARATGDFRMHIFCMPFQACLKYLKHVVRHRTLVQQIVPYSALLPCNMAGSVVPNQKLQLQGQCYAGTRTETLLLQTSQPLWYILRRFWPRVLHNARLLFKQKRYERLGKNSPWKWAATRTLRGLLQPHVATSPCSTDGWIKSWMLDTLFPFFLARLKCCRWDWIKLQFDLNLRRTCLA